MYSGTDKNRPPGTAYRQTECTGCPHRVLPEDSPALMLAQRAGDLHIKTLSLSKNQIQGKKEVEKGYKGAFESLPEEKQSILIGRKADFAERAGIDL